MKILNFKLTEEDFILLTRAAAINRKEKHRKDYGVSTYVKEKALRSAKMLIARADK